MSKKILYDDLNLAVSMLLFVTRFSKGKAQGARIPSYVVRVEIQPLNNLAPIVMKNETSKWCAATKSFHTQLSHRKKKEIDSMPFRHFMQKSVDVDVGISLPSAKNGKIVQ